jgi:hypothetical protein
MGLQLLVNSVIVIGHSPVFNNSTIKFPVQTRFLNSSLTMRKASWSVFATLSKVVVVITSQISSAIIKTSQSSLICLTSLLNSSRLNSSILLKIKVIWLIIHSYFLLAKASLLIRMINSWEVLTNSYKWR